MSYSDISFLSPGKTVPCFSASLLITPHLSLLLYCSWFKQVSSKTTWHSLSFQTQHCLLHQTQQNLNNHFCKASLFTTIKFSLMSLKSKSENHFFVTTCHFWSNNRCSFTSNIPFSLQIICTLSLGCYCNVVPIQFDQLLETTLFSYLLSQ